MLYTIGANIGEHASNTFNRANNFAVSSIGKILDKKDRINDPDSPFKTDIDDAETINIYAKLAAFFSNQLQNSKTKNSTMPLEEK